MPPLFTVSGEHSWRTAGIPEFDWDLANTDGSGTLGGRSLRLPRGRLVGGTSMINATIAARGAPFDFDRWAAMGNVGWAWADLLPLFIAIENDLDFGDQRDPRARRADRHPALSVRPLGPREPRHVRGLPRARRAGGARPQRAGRPGRRGRADAPQPLQGGSPGHSCHLSAGRPAPSQPDHPGRLPRRPDPAQGQPRGGRGLQRQPGPAPDGAGRPGRDQCRRLQQPGHPPALRHRAGRVAAPAGHRGQRPTCPSAGTCWTTPASACSSGPRGSA